MLESFEISWKQFNANFQPGIHRSKPIGPGVKNQPIRNGRFVDPCLHNALLIEELSKWDLPT